MLTAGVVGYGMAGRNIHARLLREAGCRVTDVVTGNPERAAEAESDWAGVRVHPDLAALLRTARPDVLIIASPTGRHVENAMLALDAGIPVVVDKPLALDHTVQPQWWSTPRRPGHRSPSSTTGGGTANN